MTQNDSEILPQDPPFSGLSFADFKFADSVRWTLNGILHEGWVVKINRKSITVKIEEANSTGFWTTQFYIPPSQLFKGHLS